jgi:hypothetical protein
MCHSGAAEFELIGISEARGGPFVTAWKQAVSARRNRPILRAVERIRPCETHLKPFVPFHSGAGENQNGTTHCAPGPVKSLETAALSSLQMFGQSSQKRGAYSVRLAHRG